MSRSKQSGCRHGRSCWVCGGETRAKERQGVIVRDEKERRRDAELERLEDEDVDSR